MKKEMGRTNNMNLTSVEELITEDFGVPGSAERNAYDMECDAFIIGEQLKAERARAGLTQEQLAEKVGSKKSFISRIENGRADIVRAPAPTGPLWWQGVLKNGLF